MFSFVFPALCTLKGPEGGTRRAAKQPRKRPYGYWKKTANLVAELQDFCAQSGEKGRMPTHSELLSAGRADIAGAIHRNGTWKTAADDAGLVLTSIVRPRSLYLTFCTDIKSPRMRPYRYWRDFENLRRELEQFMESQSSGADSLLPSAQELEAARRTDLVRAIGMHGGFERVARLLRFRARYHSRAYWLQIDNIDKALRQFIAEFGEDGVMPPVALLRRCGPPGLLSAIEKWHGGCTAVSRRLGFVCMHPRRPHGYWKQRENRIAELNAFLEEYRELHPDSDHSTMPPNNDLIRLGRADLVRAICRYEGYSAMATLVGLRPFGKKSSGETKSANS